jgi:hypothetical protein
MDRAHQSMSSGVSAACFARGVHIAVGVAAGAHLGVACG